MNFVVALWRSPYLTPSLQYNYRPGVSELTRASQQELQHVKQALLRQSIEVLDDHTIMQLFDSLPTIAADDINGYFVGHFARSGNISDWLDKVLRVFQSMGVRWGKRARNVRIMDPGIAIIGDMHRSSVVLPLLWTGNSELFDFSFRGKTSAAMVYDNLAIIDHFRILQRSGRHLTLLGAFTIRQRHAGFFVLKTVDELNDAAEGVNKIKYLQYVSDEEQEVQTESSFGTVTEASKLDDASFVAGVATKVQQKQQHKSSNGSSNGDNGHRAHKHR